jgi:Tfp pilus assembly protein PilP
MNQQELLENVYTKAFDDELSKIAAGGKVLKGTFGAVKRGVKATKEFVQNVAKPESNEYTKLFRGPGEAATSNAGAAGANLGKKIRATTANVKQKVKPKVQKAQRAAKGFVETFKPEINQAKGYIKKQLDEFGRSAAQGAQTRAGEFAGKQAGKLEKVKETMRAGFREPPPPPPAPALAAPATQPRRMNPMHIAAGVGGAGFGMAGGAYAASKMTQRR